ncbi:DUF2169 family type VI secretion system accessory protein [Kaarinaea lacus]
MAYKGIENKSHFEAELVIHPDLSLNDQLLVLVKATYEIADAHTLKLAEKQLPINLTGVYMGEPGKSSLLYPSECCIEKNSTDVYLHGHAQTPEQQPQTMLDVGLRVGEDIRKVVRVYGDRMWQFVDDGNGGARAQITEPKPFTKMPLIYENAFGGIDETPEKEEEHEFEWRNPIGKGMMAENSLHEEFVYLPNIEQPDQLISSYTDRPLPAGFGPIPEDWEPRRKLAGTYDEEWERTRMPMLPEDFDRRFFNSAHPDLVAGRFLDGNEDVEIVNASPMGHLHFNLPAEIPGVSVQMREVKPEVIRTLLDSIMINTDNNTVELLWRATCKIQNQIADLEKIYVWEKNYLKQQYQAAAAAAG